MTTVPRRRVAVFAAITTAGLLLAGCGSGPSEVGAAAIVGDTAIPLSTVQQRIDVVLKKEQAAQQLQQQHKLDQVSRSIVTVEVLHALTLKAQQQEHLTIDETQVQQLIQQAGGAEAATKNTIEDPSTFPDAVRDQLREVALARKYLDKLQITFDYVAATDKQDATKKAQQLAANPQNAAAIVGKANGASGQGGVDQKLTAADLLQSQNASAFLPLLGVPENTVVAVPLGQDQTQWLVALVTKRDTNAVAKTDASGSSAGDQADQQTLSQIGVQLLAPIAAESNLKINPRYGVWDPVTVSVVAAADQAAGFQLPVKAASNQ